MGNDISNKDDIIDSRDVIERIQVLEAIEGIGDKINDLIEDEDAKELVSLRQLEFESEDYAPDWKHSATLIRYSYFKSYAQYLAGVSPAAVYPANTKWPMNHIDWDAAADELKQDYTEVDFDGVAYFVR